MITQQTLQSFFGCDTSLQHQHVEYTVRPQDEAPTIHSLAGLFKAISVQLLDDVDVCVSKTKDASKCLLSLTCGSSVKRHLILVVRGSLNFFWRSRAMQVGIRDAMTSLSSRGAYKQKIRACSGYAIVSLLRMSASQSSLVTNVSSTTAHCSCQR